MYLHFFPNEVLAIIFEFDCTYHTPFKNVLDELKLLPKKNFIISDEQLRLVSHINFEPMLSCDTCIVYSPTPIKQSLCVLVDNIKVVVEHQFIILEIFRKNLLRTYGMDSWGLTLFNEVDHTDALTL